MRIKEIKAKGKFVVLKFEKVDDGMFKKKGSLLIPSVSTSNPQENASQKDTTRWRAFIFDIGPDVENPSYKIGDMVVFNNYDIKYVGSDDDNTFGIVQGHNIMATYAEEEEETTN